MIGIIETELNAFSIMENIKNKYPNININIYYLKDNIEEGVAKLKDNRIIIVPDIYKKALSEKYPNIHFLSLKTLVLKDSYELNQEELVNAIIKGNDKEITNILNTISINKDTVIIINNPILLWIKPKIQEIFSNSISSNIDILLEDLEQVIAKEKIDSHQEGNIMVIV